MIDRKIFKNMKPTMRKKDELRLTKDHEHFITLMLDHDLKLPNIETKSFRNILAHLSKLKGGTLYNDISDFSKWHGRRFTHQEIEQTILNFASSRNDESVEPVDKKWVKSLSMGVFFYDPHSVGSGRAPFLYFLEHPPKLLVQEVNPMITNRLIGRFIKEINPTFSENGSRRSFVEASNRCINFYHNHRKEFRLPGTPLIISDWLFDAVKTSWSVKKGAPIFPSYFASDLTWNNIMPQYLQRQGVFQSSVKMYGAKS